EGARTGKRAAQAATLAAICRAFGPGVQIGGGVRDRAAAEAVFEAGATRGVVGTSAVKDPDFVRALAEAHPRAAILAVDAKDGLVAVDGWTEASTLNAVDVARRFDGVAIDSLLYTDVSRDGTRVGPAVEASIRLARTSGRAVLASGGVGALDHLRALRGAA